MAGKRNQYRSKNTSSDKEKKPVPRKKSRKKKVSKIPFFTKAIKFFRSDKTQRVIGSAFILSAVFLTIAFVSYLFTWKVDQDKISGVTWYEFLFYPEYAEISPDNWLGRVGAILSHLFIYSWFGFASFLFVLNFFVIGFKILTKITLIPITKMIKVSAVALIWLSVSLSFFISEKYVIIGGAFGLHVKTWLSNAFGTIGTLFLILFTLFAAVVLLFNPNFKWISDFFSGQFKRSSEEKEDEDLKASEFIDEENESLEEEIDDKKSIEEPILGEEALVTEESITEPEIETPVPFPLELDSESNKSEELETESIEDDTFSVEVAEQKEVALSEEEIGSKLEEFGEYDPKLDLSSYTLPNVDLLQNHGDNRININKEELESNKNKIIDTLGNYNIKISKIKATIGPTVTLYEIVPAPGVRISKIKNLEDDIALSLSALGIRIIAPIPGKGTIGIEVPNSSADIVSMRTLISSDKFQNSDLELPVAMGKTISNETFVFDLAKMPHLLMAGATGQGKSVGLNALLVSILYKKHPAQVKFVLVDPKKVELTLFNKIERHFLAKLPDEAEAIITDTQKVVNTVNSLCIEMDQRYELLKEAQVRNIKEYNSKFVARKLNPEKGHRYLPYIVLVIDEFADLIMTAGKEIEMPIARLAQLARAIGIHLIVATQRPSVNIITGTIKANFPARIAFRVTSKIDSRTILDAGGADQLIGRGDMLLSTGNEIIRLQCGFVDTPEVEKVTEYIGSQRAYPSAFLLPEYIDENSSEKGGVDLDDRDELFEEAARVIVMHQQGSASLLQRKLKLGYNRAGRIIDQLEAAGIIGPFKGSKAREVYVADEFGLDSILNSNSES